MKWKSSSPSSLLWIHGKRQHFSPVFSPEIDDYRLCSGCRKKCHLVRCSFNSSDSQTYALASSAIIEDIRAFQKSKQASLAFFYCDFRDDQKRDRRGLLSSLLAQLSYQSDAYSAILSDLYTDHSCGSQHASDNDLVGCLYDMLQLPGQATVHVVIDGLDECPIRSGLSNPREKVLELVEELVKLRIPDVRICATSRYETDIVDILEPLSFRSVSLHGTSGQAQDIAEYVRSFVNTNREMRRWSTTVRQLVIEVLIKKAHGM